MIARKIVLLIACIYLLVGSACKVKRCASFESQDNEYKLKYDRNGRVRR